MVDTQFVFLKDPPSPLIHTLLYDNSGQRKVGGGGGGGVEVL